MRIIRKISFLSLLICLNVFVIVSASSFNKLVYNPHDIMEGGNTTIEGGRYTYDSRKVQDYLFKGGYPEDKDKIIFLTFDDGPSLDNTPKVLDILKSNGVKATFFVLGSNLEKSDKHKEMLRRIISEGHAIANHGYSHNYSYLYPVRLINYQNLMSDMNKSLQIMKNVLGENFNTRVWRLPGGLRSWKGQDETLSKLNNENISVIEWNALNGDAQGGMVKDPNILFENAIKTARDANCIVILMHDFAGKAGEISSQALPRIIGYFKEKGYEFRTLH